jgi:hypothetical protein
VHASAVQHSNHRLLLRLVTHIEGRDSLEAHPMSLVDVDVALQDMGQTGHLDAAAPGAARDASTVVLHAAVRVPADPVLQRSVAYQGRGVRADELADERAQRGRGVGVGGVGPVVSVADRMKQATAISRLSD